MQNLIPEIEIGKKYLWRGGTMELQCPYCQCWFGSDYNGHEEIVEIEGTLEDLGPGYCRKCLRILGDYPGFYVCSTSKGYSALPYTQLEEL